MLFGTVNAGRRHWEQAVDALAAADPAWLRGMITRRVPLARWSEALERQPDDIKVVVDLDGMTGLRSPFRGRRRRGCSPRARAGTTSARSCCGSTSSADKCTAARWPPTAASTDVATISLDRHVGAVAPAPDGGYVVAAGPGFLFVDEDGIGPGAGPARGAAGPTCG